MSRDKNKALLLAKGALRGLLFVICMQINSVFKDWQQMSLLTSFTENKG